MCHDAERPPIARSRKDDLGRQCLQLHDFGVAIVRSASAPFNPSLDEIVFPTPSLHPPAAAVLVLVRGLVKHEAVGGTAGFGPRRFAFRELFVVGTKIVSEQRQAKAALPLERAVTGAAVAAEPTQ